MTNPLQQGPEARDPNTTSEGGVTYPVAIDAMTFEDAMTAAAALVCVLMEERPDVLPSLFPGTGELLTAISNAIKLGPTQ